MPCELRSRCPATPLGTGACQARTRRGGGVRQRPTFTFLLQACTARLLHRHRRPPHLGDDLSAATPASRPGRRAPAPRPARRGQPHRRVRLRDPCRTRGLRPDPARFRHRCERADCHSKGRPASTLATGAGDARRPPPLRSGRRRGHGVLLLAAGAWQSLDPEHVYAAGGVVPGDSGRRHHLGGRPRGRRDRHDRPPHRHPRQRRTRGFRRLTRLAPQVARSGQRSWTSLDLQEAPAL